MIGGRWWIFAVAFAVAGCASAPAPAATPAPAAPSADVAAISPAELRRDLFAFADDSFRGRETGTPDANRAAVFIADRLSALGLEPAGDSMYMQRVPLVRDRFTSATKFEATVDGRTVPLALGEDLIPLINLGPGIPEPKRNVSAPLVFAGYGVQNPKLRRDDLGRLDAQGKVVVVLQGAPANADSATKKQLEAQSELSARLGRILPMQPAAIIVLFTDGMKNLYSEIAPDLMRAVSSAGKTEAASDAYRPLPMILFGMAKAGSPLLPSSYPADDASQPLRGREFSGRIEVRHDPFTAYNVVGVVRGTDARLNKSYVAYGAHYDHIGIQKPVNGDSIANGADDDGSGSMVLLAIARRTMAQRPRRSVLFVWHIGEEKGLLGSSYFTEHPTVPIDSIVAQLNADMVGRNKPGEFYIVGPVAAPNNQSRTLGKILDSLNAASPQPLRVVREFDDPDHPEQIYTRSDHYNYAKKGIPILFFTSGLHEDYHKVTDEPRKIDYTGMAAIARLMFEVGQVIGNRGTRPR